MEMNRAVRVQVMVLFMVCLCFVGVMLFLISGAAKGVLMPTVMILICTNCLVGITTFSSDALRTAVSPGLTTPNPLRQLC